LPLTNKQIKGFLFAVEGVGAVFVSIFMIVYLAGLSRLPSDVVYHSEPAVRMPMSIIGAVLVVLVLVALVLAVVISRKNEN